MDATFYDTLTAAVRDIETYGYDSQQRIDTWMRELRAAAVRELLPEADMQRAIRASLERVYAQAVTNSGILKNHPHVGAYTLKRVEPKLRGELDRRIMASADLIKLKRNANIDLTLSRFAGWSTSIPAGGSKVTDTNEVKSNIRKALTQLSFEDRRVSIDQGHKLFSAISDIVATDAGAIAAVWHSHFRQAGYNFREPHKERDGKIYAIRGNWAMQKGLMRAASSGYTDEITAPGEEVFCRCYLTYLYNLRSLPADMLTKKGADELIAVQAKIAGLR